MNLDLLNRIKAVTGEEQAILDGKTDINRTLYMADGEDTINSAKLLAAGKLITIRTHTRFIDFPVHRHDYVEVVYMCTGQTTHIVNGKEILLRPGELLFMNQSATHAVRKAGLDDVAVNFIILPTFFTVTLSAIGTEDSYLRRFLVDCLCGQNTGSGYLHFQVADIPPIQNLVENLLWTLVMPVPNRRRISQMTMALLVMQLVNYAGTLASEGLQEDTILRVLRCIEANYASCTLGEIADSMHYDLAWLSREIKKQTGKTFTDILQERRLSQAAFLIKSTSRNIADICHAVGYENVSYFHRLFFKTYGMSPKHYRDQG